MSDMDGIASDVESTRSHSPDLVGALRRTRSSSDFTGLVQSEKLDLMSCNPYVLDPRIRLQDITPFKHADLLYDAKDRRAYVLDGRYVLKLMRPELDVDMIAAHMKEARTVIPVPVVHRAGRGLGYTYILMDYIPAQTLEYYIRRDPAVDISTLARKIGEVVDGLASLGLAHNDLHPWNILVDPQLNVMSVIDWDLAGPLEDSFEYQRRVVATSPSRGSSHEWDAVFRKHHSSLMLNGYGFSELEYGQPSLPTVTARSF